MKIRIQITIGMVAFCLLFLTFCHQFACLSQVNAQISQARELKFFSILFSEDLRRSSDEMTSMARFYVASANPEFKSKFEEVLDIREGRSHRELDSDKSILAIFRNDHVCPEPFNKPLPFLQIAKRAGFTPGEYALLEKAKLSSDALAELEFSAFHIIQKNPGSTKHRLQALEMLVSDDYMSRKTEIMDLIHDFQSMVAKRTSLLISEAKHRADHTRGILIGLGCLLAGFALACLLIQSLRASRFKDTSHTDPLTNLASRSYLQDYLEKNTLNAEAHGEIVLLAFLDLNGFKPINDRHGHRKGDELLKDVANCLRSQCRDHDLVARYGGDEFVIVFVSAMNYRSESIARMQQSIVRAFDEIKDVPDGMRIGVAAGISVYPCPAPTVEALIRTADEAMYRAKQCSDSITICLYEPENSLACQTYES
jgi:diguanylate cyclase (GGDEF)-like protein